MRQDEKKYAFAALQGRDDATGGWAEIDSLDGYRYAINPRHVLAWQWLFEPEKAEDLEEGPSAHEQKDRPDVLIHFADRQEPWDFRCDPDDPPDEVGNLGDLAGVFMSLGLNDPSEEASYYFTDLDGEMVFFYANDVSMLAAQLPLISDFQEAEDVAIEQQIEEAEVLGGDDTERQA